MPFNSLGFIFIFLPTTILGYFTINKISTHNSAKIWIIVSSLIFYSYYSISYVPIILASIVINFIIGRLLQNRKNIKSLSNSKFKYKLLFFIGICVNIILLGFFKYINFLLDTINIVTHSDFHGIAIALPLAISFYTFQQISFLADSYTHKTTESKFLDYCFFVLFFPQLIAGPILRYRELIPQFIKKNRYIDWDNMATGSFVFCSGLFKKVVIADSFAAMSLVMLGTEQNIGFLDSWIASLCYSFQLYYDFAGYSDMAIGAGLMFNIKLPLNFNSPYCAQNIQEFWRCWHITLSRWLRDYVYIPLGGNRKGANRTLLNIFVTFLIGGIWHGAGWTFVIWGILHGTALAVHRIWKIMGLKMNSFWGSITTFMFINFAWVFFSSVTVKEAVTRIKGMFGLNGHLTILEEITHYYEKLKLLKMSNPHDMPVFYLVIFSIAVFIIPNTMQMINFIPYKGIFEFNTDLKHAFALGIIW